MGRWRDPGFHGWFRRSCASNMTLMKQFGDFQKDTPAERNVRFGVREHGMGAIANGMKLHSPGIIPYCATFFIFTDYMRCAMRGMDMARPADGNETAAMYKMAVENSMNG